MQDSIPTKIDQSPINLPQGLPFHKGDTNKTLIRAAFAAAGVAPRWPMETRGVFALLKIIGYTVTRQALDYCLVRGYLKPPAKDRKQYTWTEADAVNFADALESLRRWIPMHPCHLHKYQPSELAQAQVEAARKSAAVTAFAAMPANELINLLVCTDESETRELLAFALKEQLGIIHERGAEQTPAADPAEVN